MSKNTLMSDNLFILISYQLHFTLIFFFFLQYAQYIWTSPIYSIHLKDLFSIKHIWFQVCCVVMCLILQLAYLCY